MSWARVGDLDVLEVRASVDKTWAFYWPGRLVVEPPLTDGSSIEWLAPNGEAQSLAVGTVLVAPPFAGHVRIHAHAGASFRVTFDAALCDEPEFYGRVHSPFVCERPPADAAIIDFARHALASRQVPSSTRISTSLLRARELLSRNLAEEADLEALASSVGVDRSHLCRAFQKATGLPPYRFRAHVRIASARRLLAAGHECTEVAYALGFCDQSHLTRSFKELTGTTPSAYARACVSGAMQKLAA